MGINNKHVTELPASVHHNKYTIQLGDAALHMIHGQIHAPTPGNHDKHTKTVLAAIQAAYTFFRNAVDISNNQELREKVKAIHDALRALNNYLDVPATRNVTLTGRTVEIDGRTYELKEV